MRIVFSSVNLTFFSNPLSHFFSCQDKILPFGQLESTEFLGLGSSILTGWLFLVRRVTVTQQRDSSTSPFWEPFIDHVGIWGPSTVSWAKQWLRSVGREARAEKGLPGSAGCLLSSRQEQRDLPIREEDLFSMGTAGTPCAICPGPQ